MTAQRSAGGKTMWDGWMRKTIDVRLQIKNNSTVFN
jgi:hypothetical protein